VELGAEVAEDGEREGVAAAGVVQGKVGGASGQGGPRCHSILAGRERGS
jgi:hypothetical protein